MITIHFLGWQAIFVATALTVYGIETLLIRSTKGQILLELQQLLPFTVLKLPYQDYSAQQNASCNSSYRLRY